MAETVRQRTSRRFRTSYRSIETEGLRESGVGRHPLTIWLITSAVIVFLYIRRSRLGIDLHPSEKEKPKPALSTPSRKVMLRIPTGFPVLPPSTVDMSGGSPK